MPVESKEKQLVLKLLRLVRFPVSSSQLTKISPELRDKNPNMISKYLLSEWRKGNLIRSQKQIEREYLYYPSTKETVFTVKKTKLKLIRFKKTLDSKQLKKTIISILETKGPHSVKEITQDINPDYDKSLLDKINFHCQDLYNKDQLLRSSKPYRYHLKKAESKIIDETKSSTPTLILNILEQQKKALFTSELVLELKKLKIETKLSTVSLALKRLCRQKQILSSQTQFGTRSAKTGYIWGLDRASVQKRFLVELPPRLITHPLLIGSAVGDIARAIKIQPVKVLRYIQRISAEFEEFELENENMETKLRRVRNAS